MPSRASEDNNTISLVDIRQSNPNAAAELLAAATSNGFVFIENNEAGIPPAEIDNMFHLSRAFFSSPIEVKQEVSISSSQAGKNHGWLSQGVEKLDPQNQRTPDVKEAFNIAEPILVPGSNTDNAQLRLQQALPRPLQAHAQTILAFQTACLKLCHRLLELFALSLGLEESWFVARHDPSSGPSGTVLRMLYYPQLKPRPETSAALEREGEETEGTELRAGAHSDFGSLTLLFQRPGQPGLEILTPEGSWAGVPVDPRPSPSTSNSHSAEHGDGHEEADQRPVPILVNIGDLLEDWTGGLLKSTKHRVVFPQGESGDRYSMAYFCHPNDDALLEAVPSDVVREHQAKSGRKGRREGEVITAKDHLMERLAATYTLQS